MSDDGSVGFGPVMGAAHAAGTASVTDPMAFGVLKVSVKKCNRVNAIEDARRTTPWSVVALAIA